jgi:hypothetical protein
VDIGNLIAHGLKSSCTRTAGKVTMTKEDHAMYGITFSEPRTAMNVLLEVLL